MIPIGSANVQFLYPREMGYLDYRRLGTCRQTEMTDIQIKGLRRADVVRTDSITAYLFK